MSQDSRMQFPSWRSIGAELLQWTHYTLMMVGFFVVAAGAYLYANPGSVMGLEHGVVQWVAARKAAMQQLRSLGQQTAQATLDAPGDVGEVAQSPASDHLDAAQLAVADYLARRYSIAPRAMRELVAGAWAAGRSEHLDPTLILAVTAVESSFNPYAHSAVGATGLMQVMTSVHRDKFAPYGGPQASLDPLANLHVGAMVLRNAIQRGGSLQAGLRMYVGATSTASSGGYAAKVLAEQARLRQIIAQAQARQARRPAAATQTASDEGRGSAEAVPAAT